MTDPDAPRPPTARSGVRAVLRPRRVLLVEDDPLVARSVARFLRRDGYELWAATSVRMALEQVGPFDLGVFDVELGDGDGLTLAKRLLEQGTVARAVFFTSLATPEVVAIANERGTYLNKNEGGSRLAELVARLLEAPAAEAAL